MPDKKLTDNLSNNSPILTNGLSDNEIKKALEYCSKQGITSECEKCKMPKNTCRTELIGYALDLINRKDAEIESLQAENERLKNQVICIGNECDAYKDILETSVTEAKSEAYKEFDELLKEDCLSYPLEKDDTTMLVDVKSYNNLLKELVGDNNG